MPSKPLNSDRQIVVSNQINEARFKMSRAEQKLFLYCIGIVDNKANVLNNTFEMSVKDFAEFLELKSNKVYKDTQKTTKDLISRVLEFYDYNGDFIQMPILSKVVYKKGVVEIKVNSELAPYLIDLKSRFTKYYLSEVLSFKSVYSMRIYQILCQWSNKQTVTYSVEHLRFLLNIEPEEYTRYNDFKRKVLESALQEINKLSTLKYYYKEIKTGKKITSIAFIIERPIRVKTKDEAKQKVPQVVIFEEKTISKPDPVLNTPAFNGVASELHAFRAKLESLGLNSQKSAEILAENDVGYLEYVFNKSKIESRSNVENKAGYLLSLINTYQTCYQEEMEHKQKIAAQDNINRELSERAKKESIQAEKNFRESQKELSRNILKTDPEIFCKSVYKYIHNSIEMKLGFGMHPDHFENSQNGKRDQNLKIAHEIKSKFEACQSLEDFTNLINYDEEWLFKAVFNLPEQHDNKDFLYYKSKANLAKLKGIELPFVIERIKVVSGHIPSN